MKNDQMGLIGFEFEIERETRYLIAPRDPAAYSWINHVIDTYDKSGRCRIRLKKGAPRLSIKIPLFTLDTETSKTCLRLEFKPTCAEQERTLLDMRELILKEAGAQVSEKWGTRVCLENGTDAWLNRDALGNWWYEVDEGMLFMPAAGDVVIAIVKSLIKAT